MRLWWNRLNDRERWMVGGGAVLVAVLLLYSLLWRPFQGRLHHLRETVVQQRTDVAWMRQAATEVKRLRNAPVEGPASRGAQADGRSLLTLVDQTGKAAGLGAAMKRVEPQGNDKLMVALERVSFDDMVQWLGSLEQAHGVETVNAVVDRQADSGRVNARLILQGKAR